ncbi:MAG: hypothetical protein V4615_05590 [Bacteroidota bacterium]
MNKNIFTVSALLLSGLLMVSSCKKEDDTPSAPQDTAPTVNTPSDADGAFAAVNTLTHTTVAGFTTTIEIGTAVAWFGTQSTFVDGGTVTCDGETLNKQSGNSYVYVPTTTTPTGIDFATPLVWDISGNSANGVPAFTKSHSGSFPSIDDISNSGEIATNADFTLTATGAVSGSDSVIFVVSGPNGSVLKVQGPDVSSCTFTAAEMGTLGTGSNSGLLQIAPYRLTSEVFSSKKYYFVKEAVVSKFVTLK